MPTRMQRLINRRTGVSRRSASTRTRNRVRNQYLSRGYVPDTASRSLLYNRRTGTARAVRRGENDTGRLRMNFSARRSLSLRRSRDT